VDKLKNILANARKQGEKEVEDAAFRRLISVSPSQQPGTVEHDFWQTVYAFEDSLSHERGRTTLLARTRQKVSKVGVVQTLIDWALSSGPTQGFQMLLDRGMPELTGEAIVLRHPKRFDDAVRTAARKRLEAAGVDVAKLPVA
jgi:hypothetical protein